MFQPVSEFNCSRRPRDIKKIFYEDLAEYNGFSEVYDAIDDFKTVEKYGDYGRKKTTVSTIKK